MSDAKPKWQRGLFWSSILAGVVTLLVLVGYLAGKKAYGTIEGLHRPGFVTWYRIYDRALFFEADSKGYRYSDLDEPVWINAQLLDYVAYIGSPRYGTSTFRKDDGTSICDDVSWPVDPKPGARYRIRVKPTLSYDANPFVQDAEVVWDVYEFITEVEEVKDE